MDSYHFHFEQYTIYIDLVVILFIMPLDCFIFFFIPKAVRRSILIIYSLSPLNHTFTSTFDIELLRFHFHLFIHSS